MHNINQFTGRADLASIQVIENQDDEIYVPECKEKAFFILEILILFCYFIAIIILSIFAWETIPHSSPYLTEIINNWNTGIITDILVNTTCTGSYSPIVTFPYQGTSIGCNCYTATDATITKSIINGNCSSSQLAGGCQIINPIGVVNFDKVALNTSDQTGSSICIRMINSVTWRNSALISAYKCPTGMIPCGNVQNFATRICVPTSIGCPINTLTSSSLTATDAAMCQQDGSCIVLNTDSSGTAQILSWSTDADALPIVEFKLIEWSMCDLKTQNNLTPNRKLYPLVNNPISQCQPVSDFSTSWKPLFNITEGLLYQYNNISSNISNLPQISTYMTQVYNWSVYYRTYFQWNIQCRFYFLSAFNDQYNIEPYASPIQIAEIVIIILTSAVYILIMSIVMILLIVSNKTRVRKQVKKSRRNHRIIILILLGCQIPVLIGSVTISLYNFNLFNYINNNNCLQNAPSIAYQELNNQTQSLALLKNINIASLIICLVITLFEFMVLYPYLNCNKRNKYLIPQRKRN